jgi:hypothetical protein
MDFAIDECFVLSKYMKAAESVERMCQAHGLSFLCDAFLCEYYTVLRYLHIRNVSLMDDFSY